MGWEEDVRILTYAQSPAVPAPSAGATAAGVASVSSRAALLSVLVSLGMGIAPLVTGRGSGVPELA
jgi:hypothetical protein